MTVSQRCKAVKPQLVRVSSKLALLAVIVTFIYFMGYPHLILNNLFPIAFASPDNLTLRPNAAGTYQEWSTFGVGNNHWDRTSDQDDTTGVQITGSTTLKETENLQDTTQTGTIKSVTAYMSAKATNNGDEYTNAFIAYRSNTGVNALRSPKNRSWNGSAWDSEEVEMSTAGSPVRHVRVAVCPLPDRSTEKIVVTLSNDGYLDAYVFDGASWIVTNNIGYAGTTANAYRCFDVAYEKTSGRALLVYSRGTTTNEIGYKIWTFGIGWSDEYLLDLPYTTGRVNWISLATAPGTRPGTADDNEIAMIYIDANLDVYGYVWNGSAWDDMGATAVWDDTAAIATEECIAVAYEQLSGKAMFIWGDAVSTDNYYRIWDGATLSSPTLLDIPAQGGITNWVTLKANPSSNELMYLVVDGASDLNTAYWNGSTWTVHTEHDGTVDTHARRCADFAWEPTESKGLLVWGTNPNQISYKTFTAPNTWSIQQNFAMGGNTHYWVQLRTNPRNINGGVKILGAVLDSNYDLGAISWDGTTFTVISAATFTADTTIVTYECFEIEFELYSLREQAVILWRTHNTDYESSPITISRTTFTDYSETRTVNPYTGQPWTWSEINSLEIGVRAFASGSGETIQVSEFWVVVEYGYNLNLCVMDWDLTDAISEAYVYVNSEVKVSDSNGWANWSLVTGTVQVKVQYYGFWVNGTFSVTMDSDKTIYVRCNLHDVVVNVRESIHNAKLIGVNVTVFNSTSVEGNKIKSGITDFNGQVTFTNLPNNTLTFTHYGGSAYTIVIGNTTQLITSEDYSFTAVCNQNYVSATSNYTILVYLGSLATFSKGFFKRINRKRRDENEFWKSD